MKPKTVEFEVLDTQLCTLIETITAGGLHETAALLRMARLDLRTRAYGISPEELDAFLGFLRQAKSKSAMADPSRFTEN